MKVLIIWIPCVWKSTICNKMHEKWFSVYDLDNYWEKYSYRVSNYNNIRILNNFCFFENQVYTVSMYLAFWLKIYIYRIYLAFD